MSNKDGGGVKQQHYLPENSYLAYFIEPGAKFHAYRLKDNVERFHERATYFQSTPKNLAKEGYIYETPDLPTNTLEKALQTIEDRYKAVLDGKIIKELPLDEPDCATIALFVEALQSRVPAYRTHMQGQLNKVTQMMRQISHVNNAPAESMAKLDAEISEAEESNFADSIIARLRVNPMQHNDICILTIRSIFDKSFFVISDNPVSVVDFVDQNTFYGLHPNNKNIETIVPITSRKAIFLNNCGITGYKEIDHVDVDEINYRSLRMAQELVLTPQPVDDKFYKQTVLRHFPISMLLKFLHKPRGKADKTIEKIKKAKKKGAAR